MVTSRLVATLHVFRGLAACLLLLPSLSQVAVARTVRSSPQDSPETVLIIGQRGSTDVSQCAGTLVAPQWVLTARSCLYHNATRLTKFLVFAGGSSYQEYAGRKLPPSAQLLSSYQSFANTKFNVALLKTQGAFEPSKYVRITPLMNIPIHKDDSFLISYSKVCETTSFGSLDPKDNATYRITDKNLKIYSPCPRRRECSYDYYTWQRMKGEYACTWRSFKEMGHDPECAGTPGAGLICRGQKNPARVQVHGVAHTIVSKTNKNPCILDPPKNDTCSDYYTISVFTTLYRQRRWIDETIWPERFPHPFPGCGAFGQGVKHGGSSPCINVLVAAMLIRHSTIFYFLFV